MLTYLTQQGAKKLRILLAFFVAALLFCARPLGAQDFSSLTPEESKEKRGEFISTAMEYLGAPYASGGTSKRGIDCSGLICRAGIEGPGISLPRTAAALSEYAQRIEEADLEPGDLLFFNTTGGISHVGIYLGEGEFIHSASEGPKTGVIVSSLSESYWKRTYRFSGRIFPPAGGVDASLPQEDVAQEETEQEEAKGETESAQTALVSSPAREGLSRSFAHGEGDRGVRLEFRGTLLWDFSIEDWLARGTTLSATAQWRDSGLSYYPAITAGLTWDTRHDTMAVPLYFSLTARNGLAFFVGTQFIFYSGGEGSTEIFFPGLVGVSWTSPYKDLGAVKIGFYQSIECVFVRKEAVTGKWLSDVFRLSTGVSFAIGK